MKLKIPFLLVLVVFMYACGVETPEESEFERLKKAHLDIPAKLEFTFIPDFTLKQLDCMPLEAKIQVPAKHRIQGTFDYFEGIDETRSFILNKGCTAVDATHLNQIFEGFLIDVNNNSISFTGWVLVDVTNAAGNPLLPVTGEIKVTNGAGKFNGVSGSALTNGNLSYQNGVMEWKGDGFIAFKKNPE